MQLNSISSLSLKWKVQSVNTYAHDFMCISHIREFMIQYMYLFQFNKEDGNMIDTIVDAYVHVRDAFYDVDTKVYVFDSQHDVDVKVMIQNIMSETLSNIKAYVSYPLQNEEMQSHMKLMHQLISPLHNQGYTYMTDHDIVDFYRNQKHPELKTFILKKYANESFMIDTIRMYLNHNQNMSQAAKELFVHRNTLMMRLDKFYEVTGFDVKKFYDAYLIYGLLR